MSRTIQILDRSTHRRAGRKSTVISDPPNTLFAMLGSEDRAILDFERAWWKEPGPKDQAIEFSLGLTAGVYYQRLRELVESAAALEYDPLTVKRVCGIIEERSGREVAAS